jgi:glycosyltransferase involved in cell wall biosynthesis
MKVHLCHYKNTSQPFFSVIIPTYNRANLLKIALDSFANQQYKSYEIVVVDDGSTDNTSEIIKQISDPRIRYYKIENNERGAARNFGWLESFGEYVTFLDSDDVVYSNHLQQAFAFIKKMNNPCCFAQAYEIKDAAKGKILRKSHKSKSLVINKDILKGNFLSCIGVFIKKEIVYDGIVFEEDRRFAGTEDWLLWLQLAARYPFYFNNTISACMIYHNDRSVLSFNKESLFFRANFLKCKLHKDKVFIKAFGKRGFNMVYSHVLSYVSLHLAMIGERQASALFFFRSVQINFLSVFDKRTLAIIKELLH